MARFLPLVMILMIGLMAAVSFAEEGDQPQNQVQLDEPNQNWDPSDIDGNGGIHRHGGADDYIGDGEPHGDTNLDGDGPMGPGPEAEGIILLIMPLF